MLAAKADQTGVPDVMLAYILDALIEHILRMHAMLALSCLCRLEGQRCWQRLWTPR